MRKSTIAVGIATALSAQALMSTADAADTIKGTRLKASGPVPNSRPQFKYPRHAAPLGSTVLYDQSGTADNGVPAQINQSSSASYDAEGADDFVVTDATGWNVSGFNFQVSFTGAPTGPTYNIAVYPDNSGTPAVAPTCTYTGVAGVLDGSQTSLSVALPTVCALPQGTYWVAFAVDVDFPPQAFWSNEATPGLGNNAVWQNPGDGFGSGCTTWTDPALCGGTSPVGGGNPANLFQVVGTVNGGGGGCGSGGICLDVTLGTDTTSGACGTTDTLDVSVGDQVNYCYTVTNDSGISLDYHSLADNVNGDIFTLANIVLADGASYQYNRITTAGASETVTSTWTAQDQPPGYASDYSEGGGAITDRIFCDGFDGTACNPGGGSNFIAIDTTGTALNLTDDGSADVTMPFSFTLYGSTSNLLSVSNNGGIVFGQSGGTLPFTNAALPLSGAGALILPLWDDFDAEQGNVYYETQGTAPNRKFIVEWYDRVHFNGTANTDGATFEVILDEATQTVDFEYLDVQYTGNGALGGDPAVCNDGVCATIGLQSDDTTYNQFSALTASIADNSAIAWTATTPQIFTDSDTTTLNVGAPDIDVQPASVSGTVDAGGSTTLPLDIDNLGNRDLNWSANEAPPGEFALPATGLALRDAARRSGQGHCGAGSAPQHRTQAGTAACIRTVRRRCSADVRGRCLQRHAGFVRRDCARHAEHGGLEQLQAGRRHVHRWRLLEDVGDRRLLDLAEQQPSGHRRYRERRGNGPVHGRQQPRRGLDQP